MVPLVSAIIPAFNAANTISEAIESVLRQSHSEIECIVVDDGSTDGTADIAEQYSGEVRVITSENRGVAGARNLGLAHASGKYVAFLDADDLWHSEKIRRLLDVFVASPEAGLAYCAIQRVDEDLLPLSRVEVADPREIALNAVLLEGPVISAIFGLIRMQVLKDIGGFDEGLSTAADVDLTCKIAAKYEIRGIPEALTMWRQHGAQMHRNPDLLREDHLVILRRYIDDHSAMPELARSQNRAYANFYLMLAIAYHRDQRWRDVRMYAGWAIRRDPMRVGSRLLELFFDRRLKRIFAFVRERAKWQRLEDHTL